jgi:hypothetical protein
MQVNTTPESEDSLLYKRKSDESGARDQLEAVSKTLAGVFLQFF